MRRVALAGLGLGLPTAVLTSVFGGSSSTAFISIVQLWWVLPLSASLVSLLVLALHTILGNLSERKPSGFPTPAYLIPGPSTAALNLASFLSLGTSPPPWVGSVMLAILFISAWFYYHSIKLSDEDGHSTRETAFSSPNV